MTWEHSDNSHAGAAQSRKASEAYEDAKIRGLCDEGARECAIEAMRAKDAGVVPMMNLELKRIYDEPSPDDGTRVLVDRLWPRGVAKAKAAIDEWAKDLAPSTELRQWFDHDADKFDDFAQKYRHELKKKQQAIDDLLKRIDKRKRLTLLTATKDLQISHAAVLEQYLKQSL